MEWGEPCDGPRGAKARSTGTETHRIYLQRYIAIGRERGWGSCECEETKRKRNETKRNETTHSCVLVGSVLATIPWIPIPLFSPQWCHCHQWRNVRVSRKTLERRIWARWSIDWRCFSPSWTCVLSPSISHSKGSFNLFSSRGFLFLFLHFPKCVYVYTLKYAHKYIGMYISVEFPCSSSFAINSLNP